VSERQQPSAATAASVGKPQWSRLLAPYRDPDSARSLFEIAVTFLPFAGLWTLAWTAIHLGLWQLSLLPSLLAAGLLVRLFMIQHDCGHGAFFRRRAANDWVGRAIGVLTLTPYDAWRRAHAAHHAGAGNLARRGIGDIDTLTVAEYRALPLRSRLRYRCYRHPLVMFGIGPAYLFLLRHRFPLGRRGNRRQDWLSAMATNLAVAALFGGLIWLVGTGPFLLVQLPITLAAGAAGVWLFYVQHQFEKTYWAETGSWSPEEAALRGSSHYHLPGALRWLTANIGVHHVHHLASRIPYYRLPKVLRDYPELADTSRITLRQSLGCVRLALWDETQKRLVSFREARRKADSTTTA
jgi:omega-6 fatty acid desaturase (delta-12 desaturase)